VLLFKRTLRNGWGPSENGEVDEGDPAGQLEVNVIFTEPEETLAALKTAGELAANLRARIRLVAPQAVPFSFPLTSPPIAVEFTRKLLLELACQGLQGPIEITAHLYLCRDKLDTLAQILRPKSLVVIGGKHWWRTDAGYFARMLRSVGHHVIVVSRETNRGPRLKSVSPILGIQNQRN
jgi:hypothetical protein